MLFTQDEVGKTTALVILCLGASSVTAQESCVEALTWNGEPMLVDAIDAELRGGALGNVSRSECAGVEIDVTRVDGELHFELRRREQRVQHASATAAEMASWLESWLLPVALPVVSTTAAETPTQSLAASAHADTEAASAATSSEAATALTELDPDLEQEAPPAHDSQAEPTLDYRTLVRVDVLLAADVDGTAPLWWGGELGFGIEPRPKLWFSLAAAFHYAPKSSGEERRALRFSLRSGWTRRTESSQHRIGLGFGVSSSKAWRDVEGQDVTDDQILPHVEVAWDYTHRLSGGAHFVFGLLFRGILPDGLNDREADAEDPPGEELEPYPDGRAQISLRLGVAWGSS